jgi:N-acetylglucosaminyldiphosphoundecaprenol N-acetyl-beta-D-mannosaminyltransferase
MYTTVKLLDYSILNCSLDDIIYSDKCIINTVNQYSYTIAERDEEFKAALCNADILLPDGIGIVAAVKFLSQCTIKRITGSDLHEFLLKKINLDSGSCFYLGSDNKTLHKIKNKLAREFPNIKVNYFAPPYKESFSEAENEEIIQMINFHQPDVLFLGMTAPKQEKWSYKNKEKLNAGAICSIGAVFDFYAENISRPSKFWRDRGLEWFIRLLKEPIRMFKRYVYYGPVFVFSVLLKKVID